MPQNERYWYYAKKSLVKQFNVRVERRSDNKDFFDVVGIDKSEEIELNRSKLNLTLQLANLTASTWSSLKSPPIAGNFYCCAYNNLIAVRTPLQLAVCICLLHF